MFEDYIQDAYSFFSMAEERRQSGNEREAKMFYRASVFCAANSLEAFINFVGDTFRQGNTLDKNEIAFLNDKVLEISTASAKIEEKTKYNSVDGKIKFILKRFQVPIDVSKASQWSNFLEFKVLRDGLIHPKFTSDEHSLEDYKKSIRNGLNANIDIMNAISNQLFSKSLRKSLLDLKI